SPPRAQLHRVRPRFEDALDARSDRSTRHEGDTLRHSALCLPVCICTALDVLRELLERLVPERTPAFEERHGLAERTRLEMAAVIPTLALAAHEARLFEN